MGWYKQFKIAAKLTPIEFEGELKDKNGFIYLDIPDAIISGFMSLIKGKVIHPKKASDNYPGAHISVMQAEDTDKKVKEIGKKFKFTIIGAEQTEPEGWDGVNKVYFITVDSPELENLRKSYGLSKKNKGHNFHITIAVEVE
jgi:hypothetical protein